VVSTLVDHVAAKRIAAAPTPRGRRAWLCASLATNLGMLGFFKYWGFFVDSAAGLLTWLGFEAHMPTLHVLLPVGISFFTFQTLSYSLDVYRGNLRPTRSLLDLSLFVAFFPQLVAGPIVRAREFLPQLAERPTWDRSGTRALLLMFLVGFFKKACIADGLAPYVDAYFTAPELYDAVSARVAVLFYAAQIYCDFSGYSEMAIAAAGLLGYRLPVNFAFPYFAGNVTEFWRRWHISLSTWLRDYVYIPLGGSRGGSFATHRNLMATMLLGGLWHGAAWNFLIWGGLHGVALVAHRLWRRVMGEARHVALTVLGPVLTFAWVCLAWIPFRTGSQVVAARAGLGDAALEGAPLLAGVPATSAEVDGLGSTLTILKAFALGDAPGTATLGAGRLGLFAGLVLLHALACKGLTGGFWRRLPDGLFALAYGCAWALALQWVAGTKAFLYFQF
jgi:alginate O-acetyltransferase complex protein AlgI